MNFDLTYKTFDSLLAEVKLDMKSFVQEGLIEPETLYKIVRKCNKELGLRIHQTKEVLLDVENKKAKLPDDFKVFNFGFICRNYSVVTILPQGTHIEHVAPIYTPMPDTPSTCTDGEITNPKPCNICQGQICTCSSGTATVYIDCKGNEYSLIQIINTERRVYSDLIPFKLSTSGPQDIECDDCPNLYLNSELIAWKEGNYLKFNFDDAKCYINYEGDLVDKEGNLLVVDHELLNPYYEYAIKRHILENAVMNDVPNADKKLAFIEARYREARVNAISTVRMPNFQELKKVWQKNRKAMYNKYYQMFSSYYPTYHFVKNQNPSFYSK